MDIFHITTKTYTLYHLPNTSSAIDTSRRCNIEHQPEKNLLQQATFFFPKISSTPPEKGIIIRTNNTKNNSDFLNFFKI